MAGYPDDPLVAPDPPPRARTGQPAPTTSTAVAGTGTGTTTAAAGSTGTATTTGTPARPPAGTRSNGEWAVLVIRRALIVVLLVGSAVLLVNGHAQQCRDAAVGDTSETITLCEPLTATSPEVLLVLLLVGLLLLPELSELEIAGVLTLKRAVEQAQSDAGEAKAEATEAKQALTQVAAQVSQLQAVQKQSVSVTVTNQAAETAQAHQQLNADGGAAAGAPVPTVGESSLVAFNAGLSGLADLLPPLAEGVGVSVVGLTLTEDGKAVEATQNPFGVDDPTVELIERLLNDVEPGQTITGFGVNALVLGALALTEAGEVVGGLAAVLQPPPPVDSMGEDPLEPLDVRVRIAAAAYAQLLTDLLGESPSQVW